MPSDKKLVAAAAHLREQANVAGVVVKKQRAKVQRMRDLLEGAEEALENAIADAEAAEAEAADARDAADGVDVSVYPEAASIGMEQ